MRLPAHRRTAQFACGPYGRCLPLPAPPAAPPGCRLPYCVQGGAGARNLAGPLSSCLRVLTKVAREAPNMLGVYIPNYSKMLQGLMGGMPQ